MIEILPLVFDKTAKPCRGIIHVGAHFGQEIPLYRKLTDNIVAYEPQDSCFNTLQHNFGAFVDCRKLAVGDVAGTVTMHVESANYGQSSSVLKPKKHLEQYPHITFDDTIQVPIVTLDEDIQKPETFSVLSIDVQGYELQVIRGAKELLFHHIDYVFCEVNNAELYEGCAQVAELDEQLGIFGFKRILTNWAGVDWGDAFYAKLR